MRNYRSPIQVLVCLVAMALSVSCDGSEKSTAQPQVVRKQLVGQNERMKPAPEGDAALPVKRVAEIAAQEKQPAAPVPKPNEPTPPTQTSEGAPVPNQSVFVATAAQKKLQSEPSEKASERLAQAAPLDKAGEKHREVFMSDQEVADILKVERPPPYNSADKIDPFQSLVRSIEPGSGEEKRVKKKTPTTPLETMELGRFKLVAIVSPDKGGKLAMVEESGGKGYSLKIGTFIGTNSGKVSDIQDDKVVIEEEYENLSGKTFTEKKELTLPKPPGEK